MATDSESGTSPAGDAVDTEFKDWLNRLQDLAIDRREVPWAIGDLLLQGERRLWSP